MNEYGLNRPGSLRYGNAGGYHCFSQRHRNSNIGANISWLGDQRASPSSEFNEYDKNRQLYCVWAGISPISIMNRSLGLRI